ncbi:tryptophan synthase subunit beta [Pseudovibrio ascidiaceicola]|uniref:tryptophan synthase subunit beta n=1 Tax=Pseudovibrio ascidiaceicola TaxID=285279 RepID=UPI003D359B8F
MDFKFIETSFDVDDNGHFGDFGGAYVPEVLRQPLLDLEQAYALAKQDEDFVQRIRDLFSTFVGRPTPLRHCKRLSEEMGGAQIYVKNEGLAHTGAHKINHCIGQIVLAERMGKKKIVAETGAGQHGLATATVCALFGFECYVYMGEIDYDRQRPNVFFMEQLGATVIPVKEGTRRLKDAAIAAMKHWTTNIHDTYFLLGSVIGPHPYPTIVKDFQSVVGLEVQEQFRLLTGREDPDYCVACVGGGSNALGLFNPFLDNQKVNLVGVEPGGRGTDIRGSHASKIEGQGSVGVVEGYKSLFLQDEFGQISPTHSISAGVDYSGIGPQHAYLHQKKRVTYVPIEDEEALSAFRTLARLEGLVPALESAHAVAYAMKLAKALDTDKNIVVNLSGRGDKDLFITAKMLSEKAWNGYLKSQFEAN